MENLIGTLTGIGGISGTLSGQGSLSGGVSIPEIAPYELRPATTTRLGGIIVGEDLQITQEGVLSVTKATSVEEDNTHPITAAAVYMEVGNINALLATI